MIMDGTRGCSAPVPEWRALEELSPSGVVGLARDCIETLITLYQNSDDDDKAPQIKALADQMLRVLAEEPQGIWGRGIDIVGDDDHQAALKTPVEELRQEAQLSHVCYISSSDEYAAKAQRQRLAVKIFDVLNRVFGWDRDHLGEVHELAKRVQSFGDCVLKLSGVSVRGLVYNQSIVLEGVSYPRGEDCGCWDKKFYFRPLDLLSKTPQVYLGDDELSPEKPFKQFSEVKSLLRNGATMRVNCNGSGINGLRMVLKAALSLGSLHMSTPCDLTKINTFFLRLIREVESLTKEKRYIGIGVGIDIAKDYENRFLRASMYVPIGIEDEMINQALKQAVRALGPGYKATYDINSLEDPIEGDPKTLEWASLKEIVVKIIPGSAESGEILRPVAFRPQLPRKKDARCRSCDYL